MVFNLSGLQMYMKVDGEKTCSI